MLQVSSIAKVQLLLSKVYLLHGTIKDNHIQVEKNYDKIIYTSEYIVYK